MKMKTINIEQLQKLHEDYTQRVKEMEKRAKELFKKKEYMDAAYQGVIAHAYAVCARDIKSILTGKILYKSVEMIMEEEAKKFPAVKELVEKRKSKPKPEGNFFNEWDKVIKNIKIK
jgi:hypothetical protein